MKSIYPEPERSEVPRLALTLDEMAAALGMSRKGIWNRTAPRGDIPCIRIGSRVLYPIHLLQEWMTKEAASQQEGVEK